MTGEQNSAWTGRLIRLGTAVRDAIVAARQGGADMATAVAQEGGDTIFAIDRHVEPVIEREIESWPDVCKPLLMIAEGMGEDGRRLFRGSNRSDAPCEQTGFRLIVDPIDGTRNIMYDKRSAWFIAAVMPDRGERTSMRDAIASAIVELPTSKAGYADTFSATIGAKPTARRTNLTTGAAVDLDIRPSAATSLRNGFAQVANFFPGTKVLASQLMERIVERAVGNVEPGSAAVFDDQYITTAGQFVELMVGHDRFCCDLRPLFYRILEKQTGKAVRGLECHPYDMAGLLVARQAGVIITDGYGRELDIPLNVHDPVHWCGYANATLRDCIDPVIQQWLKEQGL